MLVIPQTSGKIHKDPDISQKSHNKNIRRKINRENAASPSREIFNQCTKDMIINKKSDLNENENITPKFYKHKNDEEKKEIIRKAAINKKFTKIKKIDKDNLQKTNTSISKRPTSPTIKKTHRVVAGITNYKVQKHKTMIQNIKDNNFGKQFFKDHVGKITSFDIQNNLAVFHDDEGVKLLDLESKKIQWIYPNKYELDVINKIIIVGNEVFFESFDKPNYMIRRLDLQTGKELSLTCNGKLEKRASKELNVIKDSKILSFANENFLVTLFQDMISIRDLKQKGNKEIPINQLSISSASLYEDRLACGFKENGKSYFCLLDLKNGNIEKYEAPDQMGYKDDGFKLDKVILQKDEVYLLYSSGIIVKTDLKGEKPTVLREVFPKELESKNFSVVIISQDIFVYNKEVKKNRKLSLKKHQVISSVGIDGERLVCGLIEEGKPCFCVIDLNTGKINEYKIPKVIDWEESNKYIIKTVALNNEKVYLTYSSGKEAQYDLKRNFYGLVNNNVNIKNTSLNSNQFCVNFSSEGIVVYDKEKRNERTIPLKNKLVTSANIYHDYLAYCFVEKETKRAGFYIIDLKSGEIHPHRILNIEKASINHVALNEDWACLGYSTGLIIAVNLRTKKYIHLGIHENVSELSIEDYILVSASKKCFTWDAIQPKLSFWDLKSAKKIKETGFVEGHAVAIDSGNFYAAVGNSFIQLDYLKSPHVSEKSFTNEITKNHQPLQLETEMLIEKLNKEFRIFELKNGNEIDPKLNFNKQLIKNSRKSEALFNEEKIATDSYFKFLSNDNFLVSTSNKTI